MRLKFLDSEFVQQRYDSLRGQVESFVYHDQSSWFFQANTLRRLACSSYAAGRPVVECKGWFRQASAAYRELFSLRGTSFSTRTTYEGGQPVAETVEHDDGYSSVDSFHAACCALAVHDLETARELVRIAGHSPNGHLVSPASVVCSSNMQTLSHAINGLLELDLASAHREAVKLTVRRASKIEKQMGLVISSLATQGDFVSQRDALLFFHEKDAMRADNKRDCEMWICLPALAFTSLAVHLGRGSLSDFASDSVFCPLEMLESTT